VLEASARVRLSIGRTRNRLTPGTGLTKFNGDRSFVELNSPPAVAVPGEIVNAGYAWPTKGLVCWTSSPLGTHQSRTLPATGCTSEGNGGSRASWALTREAGRTRGPIRGFGRQSDYTTYRTVSQAGLAHSGASHYLSSSVKPFVTRRFFPRSEVLPARPQSLALMAASLSPSGFRSAWVSLNALYPARDRLRAVFRGRRDGIKAGRKYMGNLNSEALIGNGASGAAASGQLSTRAHPRICGGFEGVPSRRQEWLLGH
jgi:hypothetical protein